MKSGNKNLLVGLGLAAGAFLTAKAFTGEAGKKLKGLISSGLAKLKKPTDSDDSEIHYI